MNKPKYEKPVARDLSAIQIAQGSCYSGNIEYDITGYCTNGGQAFTPCETGGLPMSKDFCESGSDAAQSCWSGSFAS